MWAIFCCFTILIMGLKTAEIVEGELNLYGVAAFLLEIWYGTCRDITDIEFCSEKDHTHGIYFRI